MREGRRRIGQVEMCLLVSRRKCMSRMKQGMRGRVGMESA